MAKSVSHHNEEPELSPRANSKFPTDIYSLSDKQNNNINTDHNEIIKKKLLLREQLKLF